LTIWFYPRDGFTELKIVVSWRKVTYSCYSSSACLFREFSRGLMVSVSFRRLWPLRCQLQWLIGGSEMWVRLSYITCNSCIVSPLFLERNSCSNELYCCSDSSMFRSFFKYCCSDSIIVKLICLTVAVTVLFGNWRIVLIHQFCWYSVLRKKLLFFFLNLLECLPCGWMTGDLFTWIHRLVTGSP
jgi:hypothetical protein